MTTQFPTGDRLAGGSGPQNDPWRPDLLPADRIAFLRAVEERFCTSFGPALTAYLQMPVTVRRTDTAQSTMAEFLKARSGDACLISLDLTPFRGNAQARFSRGFVLPALEVLLGAGSDIPFEAERGLTNIDLQIVKDVFDLLFQQMRSAWAPFYDCAFRLETVQPAGAPLASAPPDVAVVESAFEIAFGQYSGAFRLAVPSLLVRLASESAGPITAEAGHTRGPERSALLRSLENAKVTLQAVLRGAELKFGDLLELKPGEVLMIPQTAGTALHCDVNEKPKFTGELVNVGGGMAFQVQACLPAGSDAAALSPDSRECSPDDSAA